MISTTPKVLHELLGRSMLGHVMAATDHDTARVIVVVGHARDVVTDHLVQIAPGADVVVQAEQNGTGHAVRLALAAHPDVVGTVLVVYGDTPLLTQATLRDLVDRHEAAGAAATVLTTQLADPTGYGRVVRGADESVSAIVEQGDASLEVLAIGEVNTGIYAFDSVALRAALDRLTTDNSQGEEYLTDVVALLRGDGAVVAGVPVPDPDEVLGVNDRVQLARAGRLMRDRVLDSWMRAGVTVVDPASTWVDVAVQLAPDVTVRPNTELHGTTVVATGAVLGPNVDLTDTVVGERAAIRDATCVGAVVGPDAQVGPYTYLRPGTVLRTGSRAGGFVEMKNADVGAGSKVPHLSYVGDATIGEHSNVGAATVFVNYDGADKHHTTVGDHVRIGSDTMLVAPVSIGDGAYTAAGSVITDDVPAGAMGVGRARQRTIAGWVQRRRGGTDSARAAQRAMQSRDDGPGRAAVRATEGGQGE